MTALGCTIGALLSGVAAGALSGWCFAVAAYLGVWFGLKAKARLVSSAGVGAA